MFQKLFASNEIFNVLLDINAYWFKHTWNDGLKIPILNILNKLQLEFGFHNWQHWHVKKNNKWNNAIITFIKSDNSKNISNMTSFLRNIRFELLLNDIITNIYTHMKYIYITFFFIISGCVIIGHKAQGVTISNSNKVIVNIWKCICIRFYIYYVVMSNKLQEFIYMW